MRKLAFLCSMILTGYMAGVFRSVPLMVLAAAEAILFGAAFCLCHYFRQGMSAEVLRHGEAAEKDVWFSCRIRVKNAGRLPVSCFVVKLRYGYGREQNGKKRKYRKKNLEARGDAEHSGRHMDGEGEKRTETEFRTKYINGSCDQGESIVQFEARGQYCGLMTIRLTALRVYDYLTLFSASRRMSQEVEVAVYPQERALHLELSAFGDGADPRLPEQLSFRGGENGGEIRQLREYQSWDSSRFIHWNLSARTGQLWVKEYEKEADRCIGLFLDLEGMEEKGEAEADAYYELLSALVLGLLGHTASVRVWWQDGVSGNGEEMEISHAEQCRDLLLALYRRKFSESGAEKEGNSSPGNPVPIFLKLDLQLRLYRNDLLLYTFSAENLEEEISIGRYVIYTAHRFNLQ